MTEREIPEGLREVIQPMHDFWETFLKFNRTGCGMSFTRYEVPKEYLEKFHRLYEALDSLLKRRDATYKDHLKGFVEREKSWEDRFGNSYGIIMTPARQIADEIRRAAFMCNGGITVEPDDPGIPEVTYQMKRLIETVMAVARPTQTDKSPEADTLGTANRLEPPVETPQLPPPAPLPSPALPEPLSVLD